MYFARRIAEVASKDPLNWMEQPSAGLAIQGLLSRVFVKDHSGISAPKSTSTDHNNEGDKSEDIDETDKILQLENSRNAVSYYKLEMNKIQLITAQGHQVC